MRIGVAGHTTGKMTIIVKNVQSAEETHLQKRHEFKKDCEILVFLNGSTFNPIPLGYIITSPRVCCTILLCPFNPCIP
jgi:hypothetical protein